MAEAEKRSGLRLIEGVVLVGAGIVAVLVAFWVLSAIAGLIWWLVKAAVVVGLIMLVFWFLVRRRR